MRSLRRVLAAATAVVTVAVLAGCAFGPDPETTSTPKPGAVASDLLSFYGQRLVWHTCAGSFQCTTAIAPLDWSDPTGARIHLALSRHLATGVRTGTLFINNGGPGESVVQFLQQGATQIYDSQVLEHDDIVAWDPRGVGASSRVECYGDAQLDELLFADPDVSTAESARLATTSAKAFGAACARGTGALLAHIDTVSTVRDLDMLRAALGRTKLDYFGFSYGTELGAEYADRYPTHVGRMVLDGVLDPALSGFELSLAQERAFGDALKAYLADCLTSGACPFHGQTVDEAIDTIAALLLRLRESPIRTSGDLAVNGAVFSTAMYSTLYSRSEWPDLTTAFSEIDRGVTTTTLALADAYVDRTAGGHYTDNTMEAFPAIDCLDHPVSPAADVAAEAARIAAVDPLRAADHDDVSFDAECRNWPIAATGRPHAVTAVGAPPIVLIGTTGDPATPYQWAKNVAGELHSSRLVTLRGQGHAAYPDHLRCINDPIDRFLLTGVLPRAGLTCTQ